MPVSESESRRVTVVSHGPNCLDGLTCAVVAAHYFEGRRFEPIFASNREIDEVLQRYDPTHPENEELWITDISWRASATDLHLDSLVERGLQLYWVDHHRTAIERRAEGHLSAKFTEFVLDEKYAACRLLFEYLTARAAKRGERNESLAAARSLVMLADDVDRWILALDGSRRLALTVRTMEQHAAYRVAALARHRCEADTRARRCGTASGRGARRDLCGCRGVATGDRRAAARPVSRRCRVRRLRRRSRRSMERGVPSRSLRALRPSKRRRQPASNTGLRRRSVPTGRVFRRRRSSGGGRVSHSERRQEPHAGPRTRIRGRARAWGGSMSRDAIAALGQRYGMPKRIVRKLPSIGFPPVNERAHGEVCMAIQRPSGHFLLHTKRTYPNAVMRLPSGGIKPGRGPRARAHARDLGGNQPRVHDRSIRRCPAVRGRSFARIVPNPLVLRARDLRGAPQQRPDRAHHRLARGAPRRIVELRATSSRACTATGATGACFAPRRSRPSPPTPTAPRSRTER